MIGLLAYPTFWLVGLVLAGLFVRLGLTLSHEGFLGIDGGAYLLSVRQVLGESVYHLQDFSRPLLGPGWLLVPFVETWGMDTGYKIWQATFSLAPIPAAYLIARRFISPRLSLVAAALVAFDETHAQMLVTGALPLIGFGLIGVAVWGLSRAEDSKRAMFAVIISLAIVPHVNMTSAGLMAITLSVYGLTLWKLGGVSFKRLALVGVVGGGLALSALPWYTDVFFGTGNLRHPGPYIYVLGWNWGWQIMVVGVALGTLTLWKAEDSAMRALGAVLIVLGLMAPIMSRDEALINLTFRGRYLVMFFTWPLVVYWTARGIGYLRLDLRRLKISVALAATAFVGVLLTVGYVSVFGEQSGYSDQIQPETARALHVADTLDPETGVIVNTFAMQWWVGALYAKPAPSAWDWPPPERWQESDAHVRCVLGWRDDCNPIESSNILDAKWVIADTSFPERNGTETYGAPPDMWEVTANAPWLNLVYSEGDARLWRVRNGQTATWQR